MVEVREATYTSCKQCQWTPCPARERDNWVAGAQSKHHRSTAVQIASASKYGSLLKLERLNRLKAVTSCRERPSHEALALEAFSRSILANARPALLLQSPSHQGCIAEMTIPT